MILSLIVLGVILSPAFSVASPSVELLKKITAADAGAGVLKSGAHYGNGVVISGNTLVISATDEPITGVTAYGALYIYYKDTGADGGWSFVKRITAASIGLLRNVTEFGRNMALSGDYLVVSAEEEAHVSACLPGKVCILGRNEGGNDNWGLMQSIYPEDPDTTQRFGSGVDICGNTIVIGCTKPDFLGAVVVGRAYIFEPDPDNPGKWKLDKALVPQNENGVEESESELEFGCSVAISGDVVAVGGRGKEVDGKAKAGAVYVFNRNVGPGGWGIVKKLTAQKDDGSSDVQAGMKFGTAVDLSGDLLLAGAGNYPVGSIDNVGSAYVFSKDKNGADQWGIVKNLRAVRNNGAFFTFADSEFGKRVSISGDLALVASNNGAFLYSKSQSDIGTWGIVSRIGEGETGPGASLATDVSIYGDYSVVSAKSKTEETLNNAGAAYILKTSNIVSPDSCADKTVSPVATQPTGTSAIVTSVTKKVKTTAQLKEEHQTPGMDSMLGANVYEFNATVTAGKVAYFCFNSSSLGERAAEDVALFKLFPNKESKSFTYSSGKNPSEEGYFWITDEGNSGQYIDPKTILVGARTYTVNYSVKDNGDYDLDDTAGVIHDPVVPGTSGGSGGTGCVLNPHAGFSVELCALFVVGLLGIIVRGIGRNRGLKKTILSLIVLGVILSPVVSVASPSVEYLKKFTGTVMAQARFGVDCDLTDDTIVISAMCETVASKVEAGAVYIYSKDKGGSGKWGLEKRITVDDVGTAQTGGNFGMALAISNDIVVVSHPYADIGLENNAGEVYIFGRNEGGDDNWGLMQVLRTDPLVAGLVFGYDVDICGQTIVVSSIEFGIDGFSDIGCVNVYDPDPANPGKWKLVKQLTPQNESGVPERVGGMHFGVSVALSGDTLAVGSDGNRVGGLDEAGSVYLFERNAGGDDNWGIVKRVVAQNDVGASDIQAHSSFGGSVALCSDLLIVGAEDMDAGAEYVGAAYIYSKDKGGADQWGIAKKLVPVRESGKPYVLKGTMFGRSVSISGDLALVSASGGASLFSKSQSDIGTWGIIKTIGNMDTEPSSGLASKAVINGDYSILGAIGKKENNKANAGAAYYFKTPNIVSPDRCTDKTVSPTAIQPTGTSAIVTSVTKRVKTTAQLKEEHQTPGMDSMLGANVYEFNATVTAGKVAYFCFNSSSLGERAAEDVALFKLFPDKESKSFTYSPGKNPENEGYFWITDEGNSGQYIDPKTILVGARTYTVNYSVKDNGDYDLDDTAGVIHDPVVPGTSGGSGGTGCVLNPQAGFSVELCGLFVVGLLGIVARGIGRNRGLKKTILSLIVLGVILCPAVSFASPPVELIKKINSSSAREAAAEYGVTTAMNKDTLAVSAPSEVSGAIYIFMKDRGGAGKWGSLKKITHADVGEPIANMKLGYAVALSNNYLVITAPDIDHAGNPNAGSAYVFGRNTGGINNWGFVQKIFPRSLENYGRFGTSVAVCDDVMVIGHPNSIYSGTLYIGRAEVYLPDPDHPGQWKHHQTLTAQNEHGALDRQYNLNFSTSLAIADGKIFAGTPYKHSDGKNYSGCVYIYSKKVDEYWRIEKRIFAQKDDGSSDIMKDSQFGYSLAASGDIFLVGAHKARVGVNQNAGAAYVYSKDKNGEDQWGIVKKLEPVTNDGFPYNYAEINFGERVSLSGDLALVGSKSGAYLFSKSQSDIGSWGIVRTISGSETESGAQLDGGLAIHGNYCVVGASNKDIVNKDASGDFVGFLISRAAYILKTSNIVSPDSCADKTVSPTAVQPTGTRAIVTSVSKKVKTAAEIKEEHQTPNMDSMLGANVYEFNATVTAGKVAYFCFNSSSLGERAAEDVALFKLFPDKESKSFTYSSGKNPSEEGYFWITDEGNSGQYIDPKTILVGARTYTVNYSVKDNGDYDQDDTAGVIHDPVVPGTSGGSGDGTGCVLNPQAGFSMELCGFFLVALLGICVRRISG